MLCPSICCVHFYMSSDILAFFLLCVFVLSHLYPWKKGQVPLSTSSVNQQPWAASSAKRKRENIFVVCYLCLNSWKTMRLGKPCLQMRIPSRTPLHLSWSRTRWDSSLPAWRKKQTKDNNQRSVNLMSPNVLLVDVWKYIFFNTVHFLPQTGKGLHLILHLI